MTVTDAPPAAVVWWKTRLAMIEVPRRHIIGWSDTTGSPSGTIDIVSPHPRLDRRIIETALAEELADRYPTLPRFGTAAELAAHLTAEARLRAAGHQVLSRDLASVYGLGVVGGVVATLLGRGIDAYVLIDAHAGPAIRSAVCAEAENALNEFETATPSQLDEDGWEPGNEGRWQLFLEQT